MTTGDARPARRPLAALIAADCLSRLGSALTATAIPWFVLVTTGSVARTGVTVFAQGVGVVCALLFGGAIVDRVPPRRASMIADLAAGTAVTLVPLAASTVGLAFWQLLLLVFAAALLDTPAQVARYSALPDLARAAGVRFERANAIFDACLTASALVGPALAGTLIAVVGAVNVVWLDGLSYGMSALLMVGVPWVVSGTACTDVAGRYHQRLIGALRWLRQEPVLFPLVVIFAVMNLAIGPIEAPILPVYAREVFRSPVALGFMASAGAVGGLAGNALFAVFGHRVPRRTAFAAGFVTVPLAVTLLAFRPPLPAALLVLGVMGTGLSVTNLLEYTI
ncbi:MAG TPA: MFS transporter, partial [Thermomicrobiaceae bacterium]|nr:MFS transporter [Thermomicrobiaceae bacterium]